MRKSLLLLTLLSLVFVSCRNRVEIEPENTGLMLSLSTEGQFTTPVEADPAAAVKAEDTYLPDVNKFILTITNLNTGKKEFEKTYGEVPPIIQLEPAPYRVSAVSPSSSNETPTWDNPIYKGTEDVTISAGKSANVALVCKLSNMKVTVKVTSKFLNEMNPDYSIVVATANQTGMLTWNDEKIKQGYSGYYPVTPLTLDVKATRKVLNLPINHHFVISKVAAQDHHVLTVDASETGDIEFGGEDGITIDYTVNNKPQTIIIDSLSEEPIDAEIPELLQSSIANGATDVNVATANVTLAYSTDVMMAAGHVITLNGQACTASASGKTVTVALPALAASTSYTLAVPANAVVNVEDGMTGADALNLTFTTAADTGGDPSVPVDPVEDPITITCPGVESPAVYSMAAVLEGTATVDFTLNIEAANGIENLIMTVDSPSLIELLAMMEAFYGTLNPVDMAHMTEGQTTFWGGELVFNGLKSEDVLGKTEFELDVAPFIPMIAELGVVTTHNMSVEVKDTAGNVKKVVIQITMNE